MSKKIITGLSIGVATTALCATSPCSAEVLLAQANHAKNERKIAEKKTGHCESSVLTSSDSVSTTSSTTVPLRRMREMISGLRKSKSKEKDSKRGIMGNKTKSSDDKGGTIQGRSQNLEPQDFIGLAIIGLVAAGIVDFRTVVSGIVDFRTVVYPGVFFLVRWAGEAVLRGKRQSGATYGVTGSKARDDSFVSFGQPLMCTIFFALVTEALLKLFVQTFWSPGQKFHFWSIFGPKSTFF